MGDLAGFCRWSSIAVFRDGVFGPSNEDVWGDARGVFQWVVGNLQERMLVGRLRWMRNRRTMTR